MVNEKLGSRFWRVELPIYALAFNSLTHFVLAISMSGVVKAFPHVRESVLMYLLSITTLSSILGGFAFSFLTARFTKKNLIVAALTAGCLCALIDLFFPARLPLLFIASFGQGAVSGFVSTAFPLMVNAHVEEAHRSRVMGFGSGTIQFGRLATSLLAGFLAIIRWNLVYLVYGFMLAALLLIVFLLPQDCPGSELDKSMTPDTARGDSAGGFAHDLMRRLLRSSMIGKLVVLVLVFGIIQFLTSSHISLYIEGYKLGPSSMTGSLAAASFALAGAAGFLFAPIRRFLGKRIACIVFLVIGAGYIAAGMFISLPGILIALIFCSVAQAVFLPYILMCANDLPDPSTIPLVMAIIPACMNLGSFLATSLTGFMDAALGLGTPAEAYLCFGFLSAGLAVAVYFLQRKNYFTFFI